MLLLCICFGVPESLLALILVYGPSFVKYLNYHYIGHILSCGFETFIFSFTDFFFFLRECHHVDWPGLQLSHRDPPISASQVLGLKMNTTSFLLHSLVFYLVCSSPEVGDEVLGVLGMASKYLNLIGSSCHWRIPRFLSFETPAVDSRTAGSKGGSRQLRGSLWPRRLGNWVNIAYEKEAARAQWHRPML